MASAEKPSFRPDRLLGEFEWLAWYEGTDWSSDFDFASRDAAVRRLRDWSSQNSAVADMRRIATRFGDRAAVGRATDAEVIGWVADLLVSRRIRVCAKPRELMRVVRHSMMAGAAEVAAPTAPRRAAASSAVPAPVDNVDYAAMAQALRAAAVDGVPFCEECEKAKAARERETEAVA